MQRLLIAIFACMMVLLNLAIAAPANAQSIVATSSNLLGIELTEQQSQTLQQLKTEIFPKLESVLSSEQREQFKTTFADGISLRKAFKSITLTPEQKSQLGTLFESLPKQDLFASLTPEQKKELFMKKKELFKPSPEEIEEKINAKLKMKPELAANKPTAQQIGEKIREKMDMFKSKMSGE